MYNLSYPLFHIYNLSHVNYLTHLLLYLFHLVFIITFLVRYHPSHFPLASFFLSFPLLTSSSSLYLLPHLLPLMHSSSHF